MHTSLLTGAHILTREQQALVSGAPLGHNLQLLSGATSDSEEAARKEAAKKTRVPRAQGWDRLQDENL